MSDSLEESFDLEDDYERRIEEIRYKKQQIQEDRIENDYEDLVRRKKEVEVNENIDIRGQSMERAKQVAVDTKEYLMLARNSKKFINSEFDGKVPYFARNVILITAPTGNGKSTITANLAYHALKQGQRVLVISNEELAGDIYNRIICLIKGWAYIDHSKFTDEQIDTFEKLTPTIAERIDVVDDFFSGATGQTTTVEGVEGIFNSALQDERRNPKEAYGVIVFDYYQNVTTSSKYPHWNEFKCQERVAKFLDAHKSQTQSPVIMLAQLLDDKEDKKSYKEKIEGRKIILNTATCAINVVAERDRLRTRWELKKSRFSQGVGELIYTGFDKGKYVPYTPEFMNRVENMLLEKEKLSVIGSAFGTKREPIGRDKNEK